VNKLYRWGLLAAAVLSLSYFINLAAAQGPAPAAPGPAAAAPKIALLDVSRVFKEHARFKSRMEEMKAEVNRAEAWAKSERERINKLNEELTQLRKGTQDYQVKEEQLAKAQADLAVQIQMQKNKFLQNEAKIYYDVYLEIWKATDYICQTYRFDMVLRFNSENVDVDRPDSVLTFINKPVVWYDRRLDITGMVLTELNQAPAAVSPGPAARPGVQLPKR
jgi:Skp family chaperone for outer membrane proteins